MSIMQRRRLALEMAALHRSDRRWILKQLPRPLTVELKRLVKQVMALGPVDPELVRTALEEQAMRGPSLENLSPSELVERLHALDSTWAAVVLKACAADHLELYLVHCSEERAAKVRRAFERLPEQVPAALASTVARLTQEGVPDATTNEQRVA